MNIFSPEDCFVTKLFLDSGNVKKGDQLIQLIAPSIEQKIDRIQKYAAILQINQRQYVSPEMDQSKKSATDILALDQAISNFDNGVQNSIPLAIDLGTTNEKVNEQYYENAATRNIQLNKDQLTVAQFDVKNQDALDKINTMSLAVNNELQILLDFKNRLLITAPRDGTFQTQCLETFFYKKGAIIGTFFIPTKK